MPFPPMSEYHCAFALFNPNEEESYGKVRVVDCMGRTAVERKFNLPPHRTTLYTLADLKPADTAGEALAIQPLQHDQLKDGGVVVVSNESERVPFAYTFMKGREGRSFTVEHPLHFSADAPVKPARSTPYGPNRSFPAQALIYTPIRADRAAAEHGRHVARHDAERGRPAAAIRHVDEIDAGLALQHLHRQVMLAAVADRGVEQRRLGLAGHVR